jgi:hypothetical protein
MPRIHIHFPSLLRTMFSLRHLVCTSFVLLCTSTFVRAAVIIHSSSGPSKYGVQIVRDPSYTELTYAMHAVVLLGWARAESCYVFLRTTPRPSTYISNTDLPKEFDWCGFDAVSHWSGSLVLNVLPDGAGVTCTA